MMLWSILSQYKFSFCPSHQNLTSSYNILQFSAAGFMATLRKYITIYHPCEYLFSVYVGCDYTNNEVLSKGYVAVVTRYRYYYYQLFHSGHIFPKFTLLLSSVNIDRKCPSGLVAWVSVKIVSYLAKLIQTFRSMDIPLPAPVKQGMQTNAILSWWSITIPADTQRKNDVIMASKLRGDAVLTS